MGIRNEDIFLHKQFFLDNPVFKVTEKDDTNNTTESCEKVSLKIYYDRMSYLVRSGTGSLCISMAKLFSCPTY